MLANGAWQKTDVCGVVRTAFYAARSLAPNIGLPRGGVIALAVEYGWAAARSIGVYATSLVVSRVLRSRVRMSAAILMFSTSCTGPRDLARHLVDRVPACTRCGHVHRLFKPC